MPIPKQAKNIKERLKKVDDESKIFQLTEGQLAGIKNGLADVEANRLMLNEDFQKELDAWFTKEK